MGTYSEWRKKRQQEEEETKSSSYTKDNYAKYRAEKSIGIDTFESDLTNMNTKLSEVTSGWQTQETMSNLRTSVEDMYKRTTAYQDYASKYAPDTKNNIGELTDYYKNVLDNWDSLASTYGKYQDADSYTKETTKLKELASMTKDDVASHLKDQNAYAYTTQGGQDISWKNLYDEKEHAELASSAKGKQGWEKYLADELKATQAKKEESEDKKWYEWLGETLGGVSDTTLPNANLSQVVNEKREDTSYMKPTEEWSREEKNIFGAYYLENPEKAYEYATNLNNSKAKAKKEESKQAISDSATSGFWAGTGHTLGSLASAPLGLADYLDDMTDLASGRPIIEESVVTPFEYSQAVQGGISTHLNDKYGTIDESVPVLGGKGLGDVYGVGTSVAQSGLSAYTLGGLGTMVSYFGQGASASVDDALARGATDEQAMLFGALVGAGEGISESIGVEKLFKLGSADTLKGMLKNAFKQAGAEGFEEGISSIISEVSDRMVMQDKSVFENAIRTYTSQGMSPEDARSKAWNDTFETVVFDAIAGAVSGGVHGGIQTSVQTVQENAENKKVGSAIRANEATGDLKNLASDLGGDSYQKYIELLDSGKMSDKKLGKFYNEVQSDATTKYNSERDNAIMRPIADMANEMGDSKNSGLIASAIRKQIDGQKLTSEEKAVLKTDTAKGILENIRKDGLYVNPSSSFDTALNNVNRAESIVAPKSAEEKNRQKNLEKLNKGEKTVDANGNAVTIEGIKTENGATKLLTSQGEVLADEMTFSSNDAEIVSYAQNMSEEKANVFLSQYDGKTNAEYYASSFERAYTLGEAKIDIIEAFKHKGALTEAQVLKAYEAGNRGRVLARQKAVDEINKKYSGKIVAKGKFDDRIIDYDGTASGGNKVNWNSLTATQKNAITFVKAFSEATGVNIQLITSKVENGKHVGENGHYNHATNTIAIDVYAGRVDAEALNDAIVPTVSHEVTHWMKAKSPAMYQKMQDLILDTIAQDGKISVNDLIAKQKEKMQESHPDAKVTDESAIDELVARGCEDMLANSDSVRKMLAKMSKTEQNSFIAKVKETFQNIMEWVNELLKQYKSGSAEAQILSQYKDRMKELSKMWDETLAEAVKTNQSMQAESIAGEQVSSDTLQFSDRESLNEQIDSVLNGTMPRRQHIYFGETSNILQEAGLDALPILYTQSHLKDALAPKNDKKHKHGLTKEQILKVPDYIENPVMILDSWTGKKDSVIVVTDMLDTDNFPVIIVIKSNGQGYLDAEVVESNFVTSVYGRRNFEGFIENAINTDNVLYVNKTKSQNLFQQARVQFPRGFANLGFDTIIHKSRNIVNQNQYSDRDTDGNALTAEQQEFFKDSKVRDENGHLLVMYHGTPNAGFTVFKSGTYFTQHKWYADVYQSPSASSISTKKSADNPDTYAVYLNMKKPFDTRNKAERDIFYNEYYRQWGTGTDLMESGLPDWLDGMDLQEFLEENEYDYDGLILDEGGVGGYGDEVVSRGLSYVIFNPEQVKNIDNKKPTSNPDIQYSDREITPITEEDYSTLKEFFGTTKNYKVAGYLLKDGAMLDFSGRHWGNQSNSRDVDHRDVWDAWEHDDRDGTDEMVNMIGNGNIRLMPESGGINLAVKPTEQQVETLKKYIDHFKGEVIVDFDRVGGDTVESYTYDRGTSADRIIDEINNYFRGGRRSELAQFLQFSDRDNVSVYELMGEKERLQKVNAELQADVARLKERLKLEKQLTKGNTFDEKKLESVARYLLRISKSNYSVDDMTEGLRDVYSYIVENRQIDWNDLYAKAYDVARNVLAEQREQKIENEYYKMILSDIRNTKIKLSEQQVAEAKHVFGNDYHKRFFGRITLTDKGIDLDSKWQEWSMMYPEIFDEETSPADQITALYDICDSVRDSAIAYQRYNDEESIRSLAVEIYNQYWNVSTIQTTADKHDKEIKRLNFEHRNAMKRMRDNFNESLEKQKLADRIHYGKIVNDIRNRKEAEVKRAKELGKKRVDAYRERAEMSAKVQKITKNALTLNTWLVKNNKDKHIPEPMKDAVVQLISAIDFSSKQMLGGGQNPYQPTQNDFRMSKALSQLHKVANEMKAERAESVSNESIYMELDLPDFVVDNLKNLQEIVDGLAERYGNERFVLNQMSLDELGQLDDIVSTLKTAIITANKNFVLGQNETRSSIANQLIANVDALSEKKMDNVATNFLEYQNATPYYMLKRLGPVGERLFNILMDAQEELVFLEDEIVQYVAKTVDGKKIKEWSDEVHEFEVLDMKRSTEDNPKYKKISMTTAQIMSIYALNKRESARLHLAGGGIRITDIELSPLKKIMDAEGTSLAPSELSTILGTLTDEQMRVADALQKFMSERGAEWGNKVTMARWGIEQFGEENYFPMDTVAQDRNLDNVGQKDNSIYRLLNMSFTKSLTPDANNQLVIDNIFDVFARHMTDMAKYTTHALPLLDAMKIFGYSYKQYLDKEMVRHNTISVAKSIRRAFGNGGYSYIINLLKDLNGAEVTPRDETIPKKLMANYKISAVGANLRVAMLQGTAYIKAGLVLDTKYLTKALATNGIEGSKKAMEHSGIALWKSKGHYDLNISRSVAQEIKQDNSATEKLRELSLKGAEVGDKITWGYLWNACELWAKDNTNYKYGSEEFNQAVADKLREVIVKTQVVDSTLTRSQMMRNKSAMVQTLTAFMSESTMTYNMVADAFFEWSLDARKDGNSYKSTLSKHGRKFATTVGVYTLSAFTTALAGAFVDSLRDDDDEKEFDEKYLTHFLEALGDNLNIFTLLPILKDIVSIAQGYSPSRFDEQSFVNIFSGIRKWMKVAEGEGNVYSAFYKTLQGMSQLTGLPASNLVRDVVAMWNMTIGEAYPSLKIEQK